MKHLQTVPNSAISCLLLPYLVHCLFVLLSFVFFTPAAHSTAHRGQDFDLNRQQIVEEFKTKVLQHMGWNSPPVGYNASQSSLHAKRIREFFRSTFVAADNQIGSVGSINSQSSHLVDQQTAVFPSTDAEILLQVQPPKPQVSSTNLTIVHFNTNFQQPEIPYHDLLIQSAILRMRISRQKRRLPGKRQRVVKLSFHLRKYGELRSQDKTTLIHSRTVNIPRKHFIQINIPPFLLSHIIDSDDKTISVEIRVEPASSKTNSHQRIHQVVVGSNEISQQASQVTTEQMLLSHVTLRVTTVSRDLRQHRSKRQESSHSCIDGMCCRQSIYVSFQEIGWSDWVLYPSGYTAYYCTGSCPDRFRVASTFTSIMSLLRERNPNIPDPVCAPTEYLALDMIIYDQDVKDIRYPDMVVAGCRCN